MCFKNLSVIIYLFNVVIICWDLNIVIMEYSPIVQSFTYLSVCVAHGVDLLLWTHFCLSTDCTSKTAVAKTFPKHCLHILLHINIFRFKFCPSHLLSGC